MIAAKSPSTKKKRAKFLITAACLTILVAASLVLIKSGFFLKPAGKFRLVVEKGTVRPLQKAVSSIIKTAGKDFQSDMRLTAKAPAYVFGDPRLVSNTYINLKLDKQKENLEMELDAVVAGENILNGYFGYKDNKTHFYFPALDPNYYTVDFRDHLSINYGVNVDPAHLQTAAILGLLEKQIHY